MASPFLLLAVGALFLALLTWWCAPRTWQPSISATLRRGLLRLPAEHHWFGITIPLLLVHVAEVNFVEPIARSTMLGTGLPFQSIVAWEGEAVRSLQALHTPLLDGAVTWFYLVIHHALVAGTPVLLIAWGEGYLGRRLLMSILVGYTISLVGFLLLPVDNPSIHFGDASPLATAIPGVEALYYRGTSIDNTIPSFHVALATMVWLHARRSHNRRLAWFTTLYAPLLALSTLYLQVHWITDVIAGAAVGVLATHLADRVVTQDEAKTGGAAT